jgi:hypothetical protein
VVNAVQLLIFLAAGALILGVRLPRALLWLLSAIGFLTFGWIVFTMGWITSDAEEFWKAGRAVWERRNPYLGDGLEREVDTTILFPPPALVWFAFLSMLPMQAFLAVFRFLAATSLGAATFAAHGSLGAETPDRPWRLPPPVLALFASAVALCHSSRHGLVDMSNTFITTMCILGAVACRDRARPVGAGILLALGSMKTTTMLPFLLLFLRRQDRKTWIALSAAGLLLTALMLPPAILPAAIERNFSNIKYSTRPGGVNDFSWENPHTVNLVSLDYAIYHLGIRDRGAVKIGQLLVVAALGAWVARQLLRRPGLSLAPACAVVACFASLFMYHRLYDMTILAIPLVYCAGRAMKEPGRIRWAYRLCAAAVLWVLFLRANHIERLLPRAHQPGFLNRLIEAVILPQAIWAVLGALVVLVVTERRLSGAAAAPAEVDQATPPSAAGPASGVHAVVS